MSKAKKESPKKEVLQFNAEVGKVLHLMIHSLYTNKDIFLRELLSNASDACDKLRYEALTNTDLLKDDAELKVTISADEEAKTLTIADNGIGMSREELVENLGTVAKSGTQAFAENMTGDATKDLQMIGQFGVGFYSSFIVAEEVEVTSTRAGEKECYRWISNGEGEFTIEEVKGKEALQQGTSITLKLREGSEDYVDQHRIAHIVTTYSDHIPLPIEWVNAEGEANVINSASAIWTKPKSEITDEQYAQFYQHVGHAGDDPWMTLHNKAEGTIEYTNLLFIPSVKPFDLFHPDRKTRVKLYVKRVYITDENVELVPAYLRFIRGIVDSEDLPLNISRETLQHNAVIRKIRSSIVKKVLGELKKKAEKKPEEYQTFWENFGAVLKEGLCEAVPDSRDLLLEACRFNSTESDSALTSFDEYISRMKEGQDTIYFLTGDSLESIKRSPQLEGFKKRGIEVLLLTDHVDDFWTSVVHEYQGKSLKSVTRAGIELDDIESKDKKDEKGEDKDGKKDEQSKEVTSLIEYFKTTLGEKVSDVRATSKLADSPVCLAVEEGAMDMRMERFLVDQKQLAAGTAKLLEINPDHPVILKLAQDVEAGKNSPETADAVELLFDQACIMEGMTIADPGGFSHRLNDFLKKALAS